jgi:hypothetical protein
MSEKTKEKVPATAEKKISQESPETKPVEETTAVPQVGAPEPEKVQVLSQQDTQVSDLVKEAPKSVAEIVATDTRPLSILELPEECAKLHKKKFRYRWLAKNKELEAKLRTSIWSLCTRLNSPYIKPERFKMHGAIEQGGMLLAFTTEELGERRENEPAFKSAALVKHYTEDLPTREAEGFYKPKDTGDNDEKGEGFEMEY